MCGIVGYVGIRQAFPILIEGLEKLEYRGYDSVGVCILKPGRSYGQPGSMEIIKTEGRVSRLKSLAAGKDTIGTCGIAHTRWATHGNPCAANAHPHVSMSGNLAIVHNGIIENYRVIKNQLLERGYVFTSDTDTEVLVQLIDYYYKSNGHVLTEAVRSALGRCYGAYAIAVTEREDPEHIVVARKASPLVIGIGEDEKEYFIASDATPMIEYTHKVVYLDDDQIADVRPGKDIALTDLVGVKADVTVHEVDVDISMLSKGGFPHFMLKEIFEQPDCLRDCMRGRVILGDREEDNRIVFSALGDCHDRLVNAKNIIIVACGTSWHAGLIGKQLIEQLCRRRVEVEYASEFRYRNPVIEPDDVVIAISQSGETADTLAAIGLAKKAGALVFGIVNVVGSSIARESDTGIYIHVGPELGVASTKAFTGQVAVLVMLALALGFELGTLDRKEYCRTISELAAIPDKMKETLQTNDYIKDLSKIYTYASNFLYLGRGFNYPVALEGALKLKEISYIHAEGYPAAEMKHGPIALVDANMPIVFLATHHQLYEKIISNMREVQARNGRILAIVTEGDEEVRTIARDIIEVPSTIALLAPLLSVLPLQMLAYHIAVLKGLDVDMPRNLAKSVTVE
ncbi:MAG: glutamine--fructose-6-phosphate transaminase (isomerizing) [Bacteroidales bacterium]|nr:glutamine--fructose-6-phosphate transaminase (isomerizing) [Bacteroidales bacterium]